MNNQENLENNQNTFENNNPVQPMISGSSEPQKVVQNSVYDPNESLVPENLEDKIEKQTNDTLVKNAKKKSKKIIIISLIIVLLLAAMGILFYIFNNPKSIFNNSVNSVFKTMENAVNQNNSQYIEGNGAYNLNLNAGTSSYNFDMTTDYSVDNKNGLLNCNVTTNYDNLPLLNFNLYNGENGLYLYSADLYDKYVKLDSPNTDNSLTKEDTLVVIRAIKNATLVAIDGEKIAGNNLTIKVNGQDVKTKKVSLTIDRNNIKNISDKFINSLTSNQKFLDIVSKYMLITPAELKEEIENLKSEINTDMEPVTINIYIKGFKSEFVRLELTEGNDVFQLTKTNNEEYDYNITSLGNKLNGTVTYKQENNKTDMTLTFNTSGITGTLKMVNEFKEASSFKVMEVSNSVNAEEISEEDMNSIYNKLFSNQGVAKLLSSFMPTSNAEYELTEGNFDNYIIE